jgi:hypothetical protein
LLNTGILVNKIRIILNKSNKIKSSKFVKINAIILKMNNKNILVNGCNLAINESEGIYEKKVFDRVEVEISPTFNNSILLFFNIFQKTKSKLS